jgi:hypothetical protein
MLHFISDSPAYPFQLRLVVLFAVVSQIAQIVQPSPVDPGTIDHIISMGPVGLLMMAVIVLWRKLQEKDSLLMANYRSMADSLAANKLVLEKMAETLEGIKATVEKMDNVHQVLTRDRIDTRGNKHNGGD